MIFKNMKYIPVFSVMLKQKILCLFIIIVPMFVLLTHIFGLYNHTCLFYSVTKIPCPACGLTRAFNHVLTGNWYIAIKLHFLIPFVFLLWLTILLVTVLPRKPGGKIIRRIEILEQKSGFFSWFLIIYFCYGIARISIQAYNLYL